MNSSHNLRAPNTKVQQLGSPATVEQETSHLLCAETSWSLSPTEKEHQAWHPAEDHHLYRLDEEGCIIIIKPTMYNARKSQTSQR